MEYDIILTNEEIEKVLNIKCKNYKELIQKLQEQFKEFNLQKSLKSQYMFEIATNVSGKIENNEKNLICPNCKGKYVVRTYAGDLYYRLFNGSKKQKESEKRKFEKMGLHSNPWATANEFTRDYWCLNCAIRWNGKNMDIVCYK